MTDLSKVQDALNAQERYAYWARRFGKAAEAFNGARPLPAFHELVSGPDCAELAELMTVPPAAFAVLADNSQMMEQVAEAHALLRRALAYLESPNFPHPGKEKGEIVKGLKGALGK